MLTTELLRGRVKGPALLPQWLAAADDAAQQRALDVLGVFLPAVKERWSRGEIEEALAEVEGTETDIKLVRGLAKVMFDRCTLDAPALVDAVAFRREAFTRAAAIGPVTPGAPALQVLREAAQALGVEAEDAVLPALLYSDLPEAALLQGFDGPETAEALLDRYNVVLAQSLLLRATHLQVIIRRPSPKRLRLLFRQLKFQELMFRAGRRDDGAVVIEVDGPESLLKQTTRYGRQLAGAFAAVLAMDPPWTVEAELLWGKERPARKTLSLSSELGLKSPLRETGTWESQAERFFRDRFQALDSGWSLEPGELVTMGGQSLIVPDLSFRKDGRVGHLDILGYWRRGWLQQRVAATPKNVVLAVSKRLLAEAGGPLPAELAEQVVVFAEVIPAAEVLKRLERQALPEAGRASGVAEQGLGLPRV